MFRWAAPNHCFLPAPGRGTATNKFGHSGPLRRRIRSHGSQRTDEKWTDTCARHPRNGQKSAHATPKMDRKVRAPPQKWTVKCARSRRDTLFFPANNRVFRLHQSPPSLTRDWWWAVRRWERRHHQPSSSHVRGWVQYSVTAHGGVHSSGTTTCRNGRIERPPWTMYLTSASSAIWC